ncbi:MAG TPA: trypsin-like peptidase domain-containing protein [Blastocatellia bacterium]|nr:trypsin-like peptidase domain-containing protein [Blastocatellia bacterium]
MRATFTYLVGPNKGERSGFDNRVISIGRASDNELRFRDNERRVSSHHARVTRRGDQYVLLDLGSTNGTMVNGRRVIATEIHHEDLIEFGAGGPLVRFGIESEADQQTTASIGETSQPEAGRAEVASRRKDGNQRSNAALIIALVAAMAVGALAGILASSSLGLGDDEMTWAQVAELNSPAVVLIRVEFETLDAGGRPITTEAKTGSGFVIDGNGLIVTNRHIVRAWEFDPSMNSGRTTSIQIIFQGKTKDDGVPAEVYRLSADRNIDIAVLKIDHRGLAAVHAVEDQLDRINQGDEAAVIGYPLGMDLLNLTRDTRIEPSLATGVVSRVGHDAIQLSLRANHGNSGGPALNRRGEVFGIVTANIGAAPDITLCTPIAVALELIKNR